MHLPARLVLALSIAASTSLSADPATPSPIAAALKIAGIDPVKASVWNGFERHDFTLPKHAAQCIVVSPKSPAKGNPWIWRARFFGHQPALDISLLDRGFHLCYCDVAGLFGAPDAVARWADFHSFVTTHLALSTKPVLEGMSRGGLIIFNFASAHPDKVAAIYADNPVCDFRSWPGGKNGKFSAADWESCLAAYRISPVQADDYPQPKDEATLKPIAENKIPIALVFGTADTVVPPSENAEPLAATYEKLGGPVKIWRKPGLEHHPHGLDPPDELRDFLLKAVSK